VLVLRLVTRGTIEERIMRVARSKLALEEQIVRPLTASLNARELRESIMKGALAALPEETEESRLVYDDEAVARLLDRSDIASLAAEQQQQQQQQKLMGEGSGAAAGALGEELMDSFKVRIPLFVLCLSARVCIWLLWSKFGKFPLRFPLRFPYDVGQFLTRLSLLFPVRLSHAPIRMF